MTPGRKFDEHVGVTREVESGLDPHSRLQIELDAALAALEHSVRGVVPPRSAGRIDVNDFSTASASNIASKGPAMYWTEIDDLQPVQRALCRHHCSCLSRHRPACRARLRRPK